MHVDDLIGEEHAARGIWEFVEGLNLQTFYNSITSVQGEAGRSAFDPQIHRMPFSTLFQRVLEVRCLAVDELDKVSKTTRTRA